VTWRKRSWYIAGQICQVISIFSDTTLYLSLTCMDVIKCQRLFETVNSVLYRMHAGISAQRLSHFLCDPATESDSKRNEYQKYFLRVKAAGEYGWQLYQFEMSTVKKSGILSLLELSGIVTGLYLECFTSLSPVRPSFFKPMVPRIWPYGPREGQTNYLRSQNNFWVDHRNFTAWIKYFRFKT